MGEGDIVSEYFASQFCLILISSIVFLRLIHCCPAIERADLNENYID